MIGRRIALVMAGLLALVGVVLVGADLWLGQGGSGRGTALIGGPFTLVDQDGRTVTDQSFRGAPFLVFFGYTHCPDVCPTTLSDLTQAFELLGPDKPMRAAFITVDPERDTPEALKQYVSSFDPRISGLTGSPAAIAAAEKAYRVYARKVPSAAGGDYTMDHTSIVYLMDKDGRFVEALNLQQPPDKVAAELSASM